MSRSRDLGDAASKANYLDNVSTDLGDYSGQSIPHIIPGVLYPAVEGKDLAGVAFSGSYVYGTAHTDGRKYYYTDIKGSKPIHKPCGAFFGSQRHKFKSLQLLEQETATEGANVYSLDGREWARLYDKGDNLVEYNGANYQGAYMSQTTTGDQFIEVVAFANDLNVLWFSGTTRNFNVSVNGGTVQLNTGGTASVTSPLVSRYVDATSVVKVSFNSAPSLGINTFKISNIASNWFYVLGIELIAQDTSNRNNIQIPSQDVVSYGKKFTVSAEGSSGHHYDPFNGFTSGNLSAVQALGIDTDTSLGLSKWLPSDAGTTYYRPFNGGRVIKWVDSSGTIKTSVNMMPPNAKSIANSASPTNAFATRTTASHFGTNNAMNSFEAGTDLDSDQLSEVAKTWSCYEFGNGNANGGHDGPYKDATMLDASGFDDIGYVMDDGLTSLSIDNARQYALGEGIYLEASKSGYITFIGTGISIYSSNSGVEATKHLAQNLPYGSHVLKIATESSHNVTTLTLDGVQLDSSATHFVYAHFEDITFHQPKRPPIPEDACVLADYMLMADHVNKTSHTNAVNIGKGVRLLDSSRDIFHDTSSGSMLLNNASIPDGYPFRNYMNSGSGAKLSKIHAFGTSFGIDALASNRGKPQVAGSDVAHTDVGSHVHINSAVTLGNNLFGWQAETSQDGGFFRFEIATPIHTSFHYTDGNKTNPQTGFESPFLNELVGGDRNLEQHTLICTPDGRSWDQLTRNTSYLGSQMVSISRDGGDSGVDNDSYIYDVWRGTESTADNFFCKNSFTIAYDRLICLKDGQYNIDAGFECTSGNQGFQMTFFKNGTSVREQSSYIGDTFEPILNFNHTLYLKRGDYIQFKNLNISGGDGDGAPEGDRIKSTKLNIFRV